MNPTEPREYHCAKCDIDCPGVCVLGNSVVHRLLPRDRGGVEMKCGDCGRKGAIDGICQDCWDRQFDEDERRARYDDGDVYQ